MCALDAFTPMHQVCPSNASMGTGSKAMAPTRGSCRGLGKRNQSRSQNKKYWQWILLMIHPYQQMLAINCRGLLAFDNTPGWFGIRSLLLRFFFASAISSSDSSGTASPSRFTRPSAAPWCTRSALPHPKNLDPFFVESLVWLFMEKT